MVVDSYMMILPPTESPEEPVGLLTKNSIANPFIESKSKLPSPGRPFQPVLLNPNVYGKD